jgi:predicted hydrocarbon binding protein
MAKIAFHGRIMHSFVETLSSEIGSETLSTVLTKAGLPEDWAHPSHFAALDDVQMAHAYSRLQSGLRTYYGRGGRSILMRIGSKLWKSLLADSAIGIKTQAAFIRGIPKSMRRKPALELLACILSVTAGDITVHTLDLDLLLVDRTSPTALNQSDHDPICYVTHGLIRECLYWAVGQEHNIEERTCRASGAPQCEFKIIIGE